MIRRREVGCTYLWSKAGGEPSTLPHVVYDRVVEAWKRGEAFFDGVDLYGGRVSMKLADIVMISESTPETIALARAANKQDRADDVAEGLE